MIRYDEGTGLFFLHTPHTSYVMGLLEGRLVHLYYGKRLAEEDLRYLLATSRYHWLENPVGEEVNLNDTLPFEYPTDGVGDYREPCLSIRAEDGARACDLRYVSYEVIDGKPEIPGLPSSHVAADTDAQSQTLAITLCDEVLSLDVILTYSVFQDCDAIIRHVRVINYGKKTCYPDRVLSACLELPEAQAVTGSDAEEIESLSLMGGWSRERHIVRSRLERGVRVTGSRRGKSSHQAHPFVAVKGECTTWSRGDVYAMNLLYSSDHYEAVERTEDDRYRVVMGIHPDHFSWELVPGEVFDTPEAVLVFSCEGLNGMSHVFHDFFREHVLSEKWVYAERPILINNWEATFFDFDEEKLLAIAEKAKSVGIEMLVMDDGWFGHRNSDRGSLGDWYVNEKKINLRDLSDRIHAMGMKLGIWFEPEMISEDSDLYRAHPDWALQVPGRTPVQSRNQLVLDLSREEIRDHIFTQMSAVIRENRIDYVKWDMNRPLSDVGSEKHRVMLGAYELQKRLLREFPELLLENCSAGGARFDGGFLSMSPQIWCSDDMDPRERMITHAGTALIYPLSTISAHVPTSPDHAVGRETSFATRGAMAMQGSFGYELDITKLSEEELAQIPGQIAFYKKHRELIQRGDYYRLAACEENANLYDSYMIVSKDKKRALVFYCQLLGEANRRARLLRLQGLDPDESYRIDTAKEIFDFGSETLGAGGVAEGQGYPLEGSIFSGDTLMNVGLVIPQLSGDFRAVWMEMKAEGGR